MNRNNKIILSISILLISIICLNFIMNSNIEKKNYLFDNINNVKITQEKISKNIYFEKNNTKFNLEIISEIDEITSLRYIKEDINDISLRYSNGKNYYPDIISTNSECLEEFIPINKINEKTKINYFIMNFNYNLDYGVCIEDLITYKGIMFWIFCEKNNEIRKIKIFQEKKEFNLSKIEEILEENNFCYKYKNN